MAYTTIDDPTSFFNTVLYTGDLQDSDGTGHTQSITGVGFQPDWVWHKGRSGARTHLLVDRVRGVSSYNWLASSGDGAELTTNTNGAISSIDSDGITVQNGNDSSSKSNNAGKNGETWVFWNWLAGGSASSNSDGSITSSVSANTTAGFSIVSYTGTGSAATVGHGLSSTPELIFTKRRNTSQQWFTYTTTTGSGKALFLDSDSAISTQAAAYNSDPTSTVINYGTDVAVNGSSDTFIAYCFHSVKGYSKIGSYTGNGNADGPFVYTGFKPAFLIVKISSGQNEWTMRDNKRDVDNSTNHTLYPNLNNAEAGGSGEGIDFLSNGFKLRLSAGSLNGSSSTYIYMAFAESPFVNSNGIPNNAR